MRGWIKYSVEELKDKRVFTKAYKALGISDKEARKLQDEDELYVWGEDAVEWGIGMKPLNKGVGSDR